MKGYPGICGDCVHRDKMTVEAPCYSCIDLTDLALHKPGYDTEYTNFKPRNQRKATEETNK